MEWPVELLELFKDPLLADVRPKAKAPSADDRLANKLLEVTEWVERNGHEPMRDAANFEEKKMFAALVGLRKQCSEHLRAFDRLDLLN